MARDHGFHPVRITRVVDETPDTRTFALDALNAAAGDIDPNVGRLRVRRQQSRAA